MKHIPLRTCIVTREKKPKKELARFAVDPDSGKMVLDVSGKIKSRGANLSLDIKNFEQAIERGLFERALKIKIDPENVESMRAEFEKYIERVNFRGGKKNVAIRVKGSNISLD